MSENTEEQEYEEVVLETIDFTDIKRWNYILIQDKATNGDKYRFFGRCKSVKRTENKTVFDKVIIVTNETVSFKNNYDWLYINGFDVMYDCFLMDEETYDVCKEQIKEQL